MKLFRGSDSPTNIGSLTHSLLGVPHVSKFFQENPDIKKKGTYVLDLLRKDARFKVVGIQGNEAVMLVRQDAAVSSSV